MVLSLTAQHHDAPQWVCKVLSPSTQRRDRVLKIPFYARAGVAHLWLVDPIDKTLEALGLDGGHWVLLGSWGGDTMARVSPFDAVELKLAQLWDTGPS